MQKGELMNDLISRYAAIDAVSKGCQEWRGIFGRCEENLLALPSTQPEIIRCKDCKHGSPNGQYGCRVYHYQKYETHDMKPDDFCSMAERREDGNK